MTPFVKTITRAALALLWGVVCVSAGSAGAQDVDRGRALAGLAGCAACHTAKGGEALAGGYALNTRYGTFYGSNLTQDPENGIGNWTEQDFVRAMQRGRSPERGAYYPAFPYTSFTGMHRSDLSDLFAWLKTGEPVATPNRPHEIKARYKGRFRLWLWRLVSFRARPVSLRRGASEAEQRGAYLVNVVGHCGECHSPRNGLGKMRRGRWLAGNTAPPEPAPNITPHKDRGLGTWSEDDWLTFLQLGMLPNDDFVGGEMGRIIEEGTGPLSESDRSAMVAYLMSLPAQ